MADSSLYLGNGDERTLETLDGSIPIWKCEVVGTIPSSSVRQRALVRIAKPLTTFSGGFAQGVLCLTPRSNSDSIAPFSGDRRLDGTVELVMVMVGLLRDEGLMAFDGNLATSTIGEVVLGLEAASKYWQLDDRDKAAFCTK